MSTNPFRKTRPESGSSAPEISFKQRGFTAGIRAKNRHDLSGLRLKAEGFQREQRSLRRVGR